MTSTQDKVVQMDTSITEMTTRDMKLMVTLHTLGHKILRVFYEDRALFYVFDAQEVEEDLGRIELGEVITVPMHQVWRALDTFKSNLRRFRASGLEL